RLELVPQTRRRPVPRSEEQGEEQGNIRGTSLVSVSNVSRIAARQQDGSAWCLTGPDGGRMIPTRKNQTQPTGPMKSTAAVMTVAISLVVGSATLHAQTWQMPPESERCPSKWGADDQRGSANMMKPDTVLRAVRLIKTGEVFELGAVLSPDPKESFIN